MNVVAPGTGFQQRVDELLSRLSPVLKLKWISITASGFVLILGCFVIGMLAIVFTNNLFYLLVAMLLGFIAVSGFLSEWTIRGIDVRRYVPADTHALAPVFVSLEVRNLKKSFPSLCLLVKDRTYGGEAFMLQVHPGSSLKQRYLTRFDRRGLHSSGSLVASTTFPFGLFRKRADFDQDAEFLVLPPVRDLGIVLRSEALGSSDFRVAFKGDGTNIFSIRKYQWGDSKRLIHWKSTARLMEVMIKELEREVSGKVTLELDGGLGGRLEAAVALAASLSNHLEQRGVPYRVRAGQVSTAFDSGRRHLGVIFRMLALYDGEGGIPRDGVGKEEHVIRLVAPGCTAPENRRPIVVGPEWDWLLEPQITLEVPD